MSTLAPSIGESTLRFDGPHGLPSDFSDSDIETIPMSLPTISTPAEAYSYGLALGQAGLDICYGEIPRDLVEHAWNGHSVGVSQQINRALLDDAPADSELVEGTAEWALLPSAEELAYRLRKVVSAMTGMGPVSTFIRAALTNIAREAEDVSARSWAEFEAHGWEMEKEAAERICPNCNPGARR